MNKINYIIGIMFILMLTLVSANVLYDYNIQNDYNNLNDFATGTYYFFNFTTTDTGTAQYLLITEPTVTGSPEVIIRLTESSLDGLSPKNDTGNVEYIANSTRLNIFTGFNNITLYNSSVLLNNTEYWGMIETFSNTDYPTLPKNSVVDAGYFIGHDGEGLDNPITLSYQNAVTFHIDGSSACVENWVRYYSNTATNDNRSCFDGQETIFYNDTNQCGTYTTLPIDNGTSIICPYVKIGFLNNTLSNDSSNYTIINTTYLFSSIYLNLTNDRPNVFNNSNPNVEGTNGSLLYLIIDSDETYEQDYITTIDNYGNYTFNNNFTENLSFGTNHTLKGEFDFGIGQSEYIQTNTYYFKNVNQTQFINNNTNQNNNTNIDLNLQKGYTYNNTNIYTLLFLLIVFIAIIIFSDSTLLLFIDFVFIILTYNAIADNYPLIVHIIFITTFLFCVLKIIYSMKKPNTIK